MLSYKFKRERPFNSFWILIREEPIMAPPTAHHVIFCPRLLTLSLLFFPFTSKCLRPVATHLCSKYAIVYVVISYPPTYHGLCLSSLYMSQWPGHSCLAIILAPTSTPMVQKKRTVAQFFDDAKTNGLESLIEANINGDKVSKHLESNIETNYNWMLVLWDE
jgi:hypothetical protein